MCSGRRSGSDVHFAVFFSRSDVRWFVSVFAIRYVCRELTMALHATRIENTLFTSILCDKFTPKANVVICKSVCTAHDYKLPFLVELTNIFC